MLLQPSTIPRLKILKTWLHCSLSAEQESPLPCRSCEMAAEMTLNVTLGERPVSEPVAQTQTPQNDNEEETQRPVTLGISGMTLNEDIALAMRSGC